MESNEILTSFFNIKVVRLLGVTDLCDFARKSARTRIRYFHQLLLTLQPSQSGLNKWWVPVRRDTSKCLLLFIGNVQ